MSESDPPAVSPRRARALARAVCVVTSMVGLTVPGLAGATTSPPTAGTWTEYHGDPAGTGVAAAVTAVDTSAPAWTSPRLDGSLYGEPLVTPGRVYVATENDTVYSLSSTTGAVVWSTHLASPVPASLLPCGNVKPTMGITGTPVIDAARGEIFVVADELVGGKAAHVMAGLSTATGKLEVSQAVDPAGADPLALLQRTGLALDQGRVVFGFGGNYGDCGSYRGRVEAVDESGGAPLVFTVDGATGQSQGSIWMGGAAPAVDRRGNVWVAAGNGSVTSDSRPYDDSDSVLELSPSLRLEQYFAPTSWATDNRDDADMSMEPALLSDGGVLIAGKARIAYLLDGSHLGGIGGQQASLRSICSDDVDGGSARVATTVYLPCLSGVIAVQAGGSPASLRLLWSSGQGGGPPIVAAGLVWTIGQDGTLDGLDPATGAVRQRASIGAPANHFPTPGVGAGLLLAPSADQVVAFAASSTGVPATTRPSTSTTTVPARPATGNAAVDTDGGGIPAAGLAAIAAGGLLALVGIVWLLGRRRHGRASGPGGR